MTDAEKIALIDKIIADFWEYSSKEKISAEAEHILTAISTVTGFKGD